MNDRDRAMILARRARMVGFALLGTTSVSASACACLSPIPVDARFEQPDAGPDAPDAARDAGTDAPSTDAPTEEDAPTDSDGGTP